MINPIFVRNEIQKLASVFRNDPEAAYRFAISLNFARNALEEKDRAVLDELIEAVFPYTSFYAACLHLYRMAIKGTLKAEHDPINAALAADPNWQGRRVKAKQKSKI